MQGIDGNLAAKSYHPTIIKLNKGISFLFSEEKETKACTRLVKSNPTFQRPLWSQEREAAHLSQVSDNFNTKALRPGGFPVISSPGRQEHKVKDESEKSLSLRQCLDTNW